MSVQTNYVTAPVPAYAGMIADDSESDAITMINGDVVSIPFGTPVAWDPSAPSSDKSATVPAASSDVLAGVVIHSHDYEREFPLPDGTEAGELDGTGLVPGTVMAVLTKGVIWVKVQTAVTAGGAVFSSYSVGSTYTAAGQLGQTSESGHAVAITNAKWMSSAAAGGFAKLRIGANFA